MTSAPNTTLLFVYGTLRRGEDNHVRMHGARFVCDAQTDPVYELVDMGEYPALIEGGNTAIVGELFEVSDALLIALDAYEDAPELYERKRIELGARQAEAYVLRSEHAHGAARIASGDWRLATGARR